MPRITGAKYMFVEVILKNDFNFNKLLQEMLLWSSYIYSQWGNLLDHKLPSCKMYNIYYLI